MLALKVQEEFQNVTDSINKSLGPSSLQQEGWRAPPMDFFKLNFDALVDYRANFEVTAFVVRDHLGWFLEWGYSSWSSITDLVFLESLACRDALIYALIPC